MSRGPQRGAPSPQNIARAAQLRLNAPIRDAAKFALSDDRPGVSLMATGDFRRDGYHGCRWPVNAADCGEAHLFCDEPTEPGKPYCGEHCARAGAGYSFAAKQTAAVVSQSRFGGWSK